MTRTLIRTAILPLVAALLAAGGCSYSTNLNTERMNIELDPEARMEHSVQLDVSRSDFGDITGQWGGTNVTIDTGEARPLVETLLSREFPVDAGEGPDLLLEVDIGSSKRPGEDQALVGYLNARVRTATDPNVVWASENVIRIPWSYSGGAAVSDFMSGFTLGLSTPLTIPSRTISQGEKAKDLVEQYISALLYDVLMELHASEARFTYAVGNRRPAPDGTDASGGSANAGDLAAKPPSRFDPQLDCVVVISTGDASGSGFFVSPSGLIVTNRHVVEGFSTVSVRERNGRVRSGTVVSVAPSVDLALVKVDATGRPWLELERYGDTGVGADLFVIGTPVGLDWSMSRGIASQFRDLGEAGLLVQTDASINPGNSGGPIICAETGRVVAIATFGLRPGASDTGLNFGIHASTVVETFPELRSLHHPPTTE